MLESISPQWRQIGTSLNLVALATVILLAADLSFDIPHITFGYILPILFVATKFGRAPALMATVASALCAAVFFYEPKYSLYIADTQDLAELAGFCGVAFMISQFFGGRSIRQLVRGR